jgi:hypothetical protein
MAKHYFKTKVLSLLLIFLTLTEVSAQFFLTEKEFIAQLNLSGGLPENLLSTKTLVLHSYGFSENELILAQEYFQKAGVDAVSYYALDMVVAGRDVTKAFSDQFNKREISNLAIMEKFEGGGYRLSFTKYNQKETLVEKQQPAWSISNAIWQDLLKSTARTLSAQLKKTNLLVNDLPEQGSLADAITGKRNEFYAIDMKVDLVAIPKFGDPAMDQELEQIITNNFPFKFKMTDPGVPEKELRKQGLLYVMCIVHTRAKVAKDLLGYNTTKSESAVVSVTYPEGQQQLRNIPANAPVYKVYFKHIDSGNVFLGNKWDADLTWQSALLNQIRGMKAELRL